MDVMVSGLSLLHEPDEIIEIRSIDPKPVISGYFRADSPAIAKELSRYPNRTFYQTMNAYANLVLVTADVHRLIHATQDDTISSLLNKLNLDQSQLAKLNKLRQQANLTPIGN